MKYSSKSSFSILEMILSLILLSIVSVFIFRYIDIFYKNYNQTKTIYNQNIDIDKALLLINNTMTLRIIGSAIASSKDDSVYPINTYKKDTTLEFVIRDQEAFIGGFYEERHTGNTRWIGYSQLIAINKHNDEDSNTTTEEVITKLSRLSIVKKIRGDEQIQIMLNKQNTSTPSKAGWYNTYPHDIYQVSCYTQECTGDENLVFRDEDRMEDFKDTPEVSNALIKKTAIPNYDIIDSAVAISLEGTTLYMYEGYEPWGNNKDKKTYKDTNVNKSIIIENIQEFKFEKQPNNKIKITICKINKQCQDIEVI